MYINCGHCSRKCPLLLHEMENFLTIWMVTELNDVEILLYECCLSAVYRAIKEDDELNFDTIFPINIVFTTDGAFEVKDVQKGNTYGRALRFAVYCMDNLRCLNVEQMVIVFVEELVHQIWNTPIEAIAKQKTLDICRLVNIDYTLDTLKEWGMNV